MSIFRKSTSLPAIIAALLWASAFFAIKIGLGYTTPLNFSGLRFMISGLLILPFAGGLSHYFSSIRKHWKIVVLITLLQIFLQYGFLYQGINRVPASLAAIINGSQPLFIAFIAHFLMPGDTLTRKKLLIYLLGLSGIILVSLGRQKFTVAEDVRITGIIFLIIVNVIAGFANVFVARDGTRIPPLVLSSSSLFMGGALLFLVSIPVEGMTSFIQPLPYYLSLFWLSTVSATAISIWFVLLKRPGVKVSDLNFWKFLIPPVGAMLALLFIPEEKLNIFALLGIVIIGGSLILLHIYKKNNVNAIRRNQL